MFIIKKFWNTAGQEKKRNTQNVKEKKHLGHTCKKYLNKINMVYTLQTGNLLPYPPSHTPINKLPL